MREKISLVADFNESTNKLPLAIGKSTTSQPWQFLSSSSSWTIIQKILRVFLGRMGPLWGWPFRTTYTISEKPVGTQIKSYGSQIKYGYGSKNIGYQWPPKGLVTFDTQPSSVWETLFWDMLVYLNKNNQHNVLCIIKYYFGDWGHIY